MYSCCWLEYVTGQLIPENDSISFPLPTAYGAKYDDNGITIELTINYALLCGYCPNDDYLEVEWIVGGKSIWWTDYEPETQFFKKEYAVPSSTDSVAIQVLEVEYYDFEYFLPANGHLDIESRQRCAASMEFDSITPYEGFKPRVLFESSEVKTHDQTQGDGGRYVEATLHPVQYDWEHHVVRAYRRLVCRIDFLSATDVAAPKSEREATSLFDLGGKRIGAVKPRKPYVEVKGGKVVKKVGMR